MFSGHSTVGITGVSADLASKPAPLILNLLRVPPQSDVLFHQLDDVIPDGLKATSTGDLGIQEDYVSMVSRSRGTKLGHSALPTFAVGQGRCSVTMIEPYHRNCWWVLRVAMHWIARGAPTTMQQLDEKPVIDPITFRMRHRLHIPFLAQKQFEELKRDVTNSLKTRNLSSQETPSALTALAEKEPKPDRKFATLMIAAEKYAELGNAAGASACLKAADKLFRTDSKSEQVRLLNIAFDNATSLGDISEIARQALDFIEVAEDEYRFDDAWQFCQIAHKAGEQSNNKHYQSLAVDSVTRLTPMHEAWLNVAGVFKRWQENPEDPQANVEVGRFMAFVIEDWQLGLSCLAAGEDSDLKELAVLSENPPKTSLGFVRLADRWMSYAKTLNKTERKHVERLARKWYEQALADSKDLSAADTARVRKFANQKSGVPAELRFRMKVDGYGQLKITQESMTWTTQSGEECNNIKVNFQSWTPLTNIVLNNRGSTTFLPGHVNLNSAKL